VPEAEPASILDASALIALLHAEPGSDAVLNAIADGAAMSVVNWAETLSKVAADGDDPQTVATAFDACSPANNSRVDCIRNARFALSQGAADSPSPTAHASPSELASAFPPHG